jgi:hypothetical protein
VLKSIHLTLLIGPAVPVPAPQSVIDALESVEVRAGAGRGGFQLTFGASKDSPLTRIMLPAGYFDPGIRVVIIATVGGIPHVLMDGIITRQEVAPSSEPGQSKLTVTGEDISVLMDVVEMPFMRYPAMPDNVIVMTILARYAFLGVVPVVIPPIFPNVPIPVEEIPTQTGTDLQYIRKLASDHGYVFFIQAGPAPGMNIAYWGPDVAAPIPQPALSVNFDGETNVESLSCSLDGLAKKVVVLFVMDPVTKKIPIPVPVPNISILKPPLGARPTLPMKVEFPEGTTKLNPAQALAKALGILSQSNEAITVSGSLNVLRYGRVLQSRMLVGVRGAGLAYDGMYYVENVTHSIKRGEYKQSFTLARDGLISNTPRVMP